MRVLEVSPDEFGFRQYTNDLVVAGRELKLSGIELLDPVFFRPLKTGKDVQALIDQIVQTKPDLIHIQHEFGYMGSKVPGRYRFPKLVKRLRRALPQAKIVATAHSVISPEFRYPLQGRGVQIPFRMAANTLLMPFLRRLWIQKSWGMLDGVIVHSRHQLPAIKASGCTNFTSMAHYVPNRYENEPEKKLAVLQKIRADLPVVFVFGYFTPEKGQDVIIRAMANVISPCHLILAGGVRREEDQAYYDQCTKLIEKLKLKNRISITGFVSWPELDDLCKRADLAVIPFRETSGSGSLADLMSRGVPVLSSDLPLNLEVNERVTDAMVYFRSDDPEDCARKLDEFIGSPERLKKLRTGAATYREKFSPENVMRHHLEFFAKVSSQTS
jgi:glycosyltransferase involved in cell wall biosynthesis